MKALSVYQPWCWAMFDLPAQVAKDIENRTWPAPWVRGKFIAIHAAKKADDGPAWEFCQQASGGFRPPPLHAVGDFGQPLMPRGVIVGVVEVVDFVTTSSSRWFMGPVGWVLGRRWKLPEPVAARGAQGLWDVPAEAERSVRRGIDEARRLAGAVEGA